MRLVGRAAELDALRESRERWVTVCGPAGVGKTRLVREAMGDVGPWCSLAAVSSRDELMRALARTIGARKAVLDGADGVAGPLGEVLPGWLAGNAGLSVVVTANRRIGGDGEHALVLSPLALEDALALWMQATERLGHQSDPTVAREIVTHLDGLPLAIEWFASRAALLGDSACVERVGVEQPLATALVHSLAALPDDERGALERIAAFEEGAPAAVLEALVPDLSCVDRLTERALVRTERARAGTARVVAYRAVRLQMRERARSEGRWEAVARAHADAVMAQYEQATEPTVRRELEAVAERFETIDPPLALRACVAFCSLAAQDGTAQSTAALLSRLIARVPTPSPKALLALGGLERVLGRFDTARMHIGRARDAGDRFGALIELAHVDRMQSRRDAALAGYEEALALAQTRDEAAERCTAIGEVGRMLQSLGRFRQAQALHQEAIGLARSLGLDEREALERSLHARATHRAGDVREAISLHEQALTQHRRSGRARLAAAELGHLAFCKHELGDAAEAEALFRQSVEGLAAVGDVALECIERTLLGRLLGDEGRFAEAKLELAIVEAMTRGLTLPRIELTRRFVAGLLEVGQGNIAGARQAWSDALELGLHLEVGFEALLPAHLALVTSGDSHALLASSRAAVAGIDSPGIHAALSILAAAVEGSPTPEVPATVLQSSSDARRALRLVERAGRAAAPLRITADGRRAQLPDGTGVDMGRRAAPRRLLVCLARARLDRPGRVLGPDELIAAGWPGERMRADAARKRLRTAIWTLRKLGFEPLLMTRDEGYMLDAFVPLQWL